MFFLFIFHRITLLTAELLIFGFIIVFVVLPFIYKYSISWQRGLMFLTFGKENEYVY